MRSEPNRPMNKARTLAKGEKNLAALKAARDNPTTSPAGKATLEQAIVMQGRQNARLEAMLGPLNKNQ